MACKCVCSNGRYFDPGLHVCKKIHYSPIDHWNGTHGMELIPGRLNTRLLNTAVFKENNVVTSFSEIGYQGKYDHNNSSTKPLNQKNGHSSEKMDNQIYKPTNFDSVKQNTTSWIIVRSQIPSVENVLVSNTSIQSKEVFSKAEIISDTSLIPAWAITVVVLLLVFIIVAVIIILY